MRVIAGGLKGRQISEAHGKRTHPMSEKVRGALFNALGDIDGLSVLDAFAGTGAVSVEAISRGAASAMAVDSDDEAHRCVTKNIRSMRLEKCIKAVRANVSTWSEQNPDFFFDVVICDPPYDDVKPELLKKIAAHTKQGGVFVVSLPKSFELELSTLYSLLSTNYLGDAKLLFFRQTVHN